MEKETRRRVTMVAVAAVAAAALLGLLIWGLSGGAGTPPGAGGSAAPSGESTSPSPSSSASPQPQGPDTFDLSVRVAAEPRSIDPTLSSTMDGAALISHMFEGLMKWADSGESAGGGVNSAKLVPGIAERYERAENEDGTVTYTFHLRDAKWSDGKPVTAHDFVYAWRRLVDPETNANYDYMLDCVVNAERILSGQAKAEELGVKAADDRTFTVTVNDVPHFLQLCANPVTFPVRQDIVEKNGDQWTYDPETYVGNGPYRLCAWTHNASLVMERSETYYDPAAQGPDTITFQLGPDSGAMWKDFEAGKLDFLQEVPTDRAKELLDQEKLNLADYVSTYFVLFQNQKAPFDNPLVRQAFALAVDRAYLVEQVTGTGERAAGGLVPGGIYDADGVSGPDFRQVGGDYLDGSYKRNCQKARELLAQAGYPDGEGFPQVEYLYNAGDTHRAVARALKTMWERELGVKVTLTAQEWGVFLQTRGYGEYHIARGGWTAAYNDPMSFLDLWLTGGGGNDAKYANADYDALIRAAKATLDPVERMDLMHRAEDRLIGQDWAVCPLYFQSQTYLLRDGVKGVYYTPLGCFFFGTCQERD